MNIRQELKSLLSDQATAIKAVRKQIGPPFVQAVRALYTCRGKVIVIGVGKSGLVAQKMATTLSSTGTPAVFLHPVEGMHGNLGIVDKKDIVFAISKSGESQEILTILPIIKKIGPKLICLTANKNSPMAKRANIHLYMPIKRETCPHNLAPTTSSTVALTIADALAVVLMKLRKFGPEAFALFHPGGTLGRRLLLKVSDIMRSGKNNPKVKITASIDRLLLEISAKWAGATSVVNDKGKLIGLVTDFDIRNAFGQGKLSSDLKIKDLMNPKPITVYSDEKAIHAFEIMESRRKPLTVLPVIDRHRKSIGIIHVQDLVSRGLIH